ncbi:MAG: SRPBCC family protein [Pseudomonadota bacterium]|nr:SRPBCC family protein [Pseudomonadota bacterium]
METVTYVHTSLHDAEEFWRILGAFFEIDWLVGPGNYTVGEHDGHPARILTMQTPVVEYLLAADEEGKELRYGVLKNPFVPVDGYEATVNVEALPAGCSVTFHATFELDEEPLEKVVEMLSGAYRMMAGQIDNLLAS